MAAREIRIAPEIENVALPKSERVPDPAVIVIFGASGDLTKRKLLPALFHLGQQGLLPSNLAIVGVARRNLDFCANIKESIIQFAGGQKEAEALDAFAQKLTYHTMDFDDDDGYTQLKNILEKIDEECGTAGNRLFYLAVAPEYFAGIVRQLGGHGLARSEKGYARIIIEKPFGRDLVSAKQLNDHVNQVFNEDQIFRIDHYLGKETVQNILVFRFANGIFESVWNRNYIDNIQITAAETLGVEGRGSFYENAGALRDVVQNHIMELLSLVAMEPPISLEADAVRSEKLKVWRAIKPIAIENTVRGQYALGNLDGHQLLGYREEDRVNPDSATETFAALNLEIENWRWAGVPIYLRAGKRLAKRVTEIAIQFKQPPMLFFDRIHMNQDSEIQPNLLIMRIQPNEGISLRFGAKVPGPFTNVCPVVMDFQYATAFGASSASGYERLLLDALMGDQTLFAHRDGVEASWALYTPVLEAWAQTRPRDFPNYPSGSWGPKAADSLIGRDGRKWNNP